jgi:O-antigen/teichoic acid export membrane protein
MVMSLIDRSAAFRQVLASDASRQTLVSLFLQGFNLLLNLGASFILARVLLASGLGLVKLVMSWLEVLVIFTFLGFDMLLIREVAASVAAQQHALLKGILRRSRQIVVLSSLIIIIIGFVLGHFFIDEAERRLAFVLLLPMLPMLGFLRINTAILQGYKKIAISLLPSFLLRPLLLIIPLAIIFVQGIFIAPLDILLLYALTIFAALLLSQYFVWRSGFTLAKTTTPEYADKQWLRSALAMFSVSVVYIINNYADMLILGAFKSNAEVGIYSIVSRSAVLLLFFMLAVSKVMTPRFSTLYANQNLTSLRRLYRRSTLFIFVTTLPLLILLLLYGKSILALFGAEFVPGYGALFILALGQFCAAVFGPQEHLLLMTGRERLAAFIIGAGALVNILLNLLLVPVYGIVGAAIATATGITVMKTAMAIAIYRHIGSLPFWR